MEKRNKYFVHTHATSYANATRLIRFFVTVWLENHCNLQNKINRIKMKIPIIKQGEWVLFGKSTVGVTIFPFIFLRRSYFNKMPIVVLQNTIRHESIHIRQQTELLILPFYIWYFVEYFIKFFKYGLYAYENLSFEREAYQCERNESYLADRKRFAFLNRIW